MIRVDNIECGSLEGRTQLRASIHVAGRVHDTWFRWAGRPPLAPADAFLALCLRPAMNMGQRLVIRGQVSAQMLENASAVQAIWKGWHPGLDWLDIEVDGTHSGHMAAATDSLKKVRGTGVFFSAGVDSFHSTLRRIERIDTLVFAPFFDNHRFTPGLRDRLFHAVESVAGKLNKELIFIETNARAFLDRYDEWLWTYGGVLAAFGHALSGHVTTQLIASSAQLGAIAPDGSTPQMDPLWSSEWVGFEHDGADCSRFDKITAIADDPMVRQYLRVCWSESQYNCCRCAKCLRTMISLTLLDKLKDVPAFDQPLDLATIAASPSVTQSQRAFMQENLDIARQLGGHEPLIAALEASSRNVRDRRLNMRLYALRKAAQHRYRQWLKWRYGR